MHTNALEVMLRIITRTVFSELIALTNNLCWAT